MGALAGGYVIFVLFLFVLGILWLLVPFLIMGTNNRLNKIIKQNEALLAHAGVLEQRTQGMLERLADRMVKASEEKEKPGN